MPPLETLSNRWYALYTRGRHEKLIDTELRKKGIESFLPTRKVKRRWSDRTVTVEEPLFKSYVFVKTDLARTGQVLRTKGAVKFVCVQGRPIPVQEKVIGGLKTLVEQELEMDPFPYFGVGDRVCVRTGMFKGVEGFIVRKNEKKCRLVISIDAIMASISVEVDSYLVEKV